MVSLPRGHLAARPRVTKEGLIREDVMVQVVVRKAGVRHMRGNRARTLVPEIFVMGCLIVADYARRAIVNLALDAADARSLRPSIAAHFLSVGQLGP